MMRAARFVLKILQLVGAVFVVFCVSQLGSQWLLLLASLVVPPFGLYLVAKSPELGLHKTPHAAFSALGRSRRWLRVDVSICLTMAVVYIAFSALLFYGSFIQAHGRLYLILAAAGSLVVALLYLVNAYCSCIQLRTGTVDFAEVSLGPGHLFVSASDHPKPYMTPPNRSLKSSPLSLHVDSLQRLSPLQPLSPIAFTRERSIIRDSALPIHVETSSSETVDVVTESLSNSTPPTLPRRPPPMLNKSAEPRRISAFVGSTSGLQSPRREQSDIWSDVEGEAGYSQIPPRYVAHSNSETRKRYAIAPKDGRPHLDSDSSFSGSESLGSMMRDYENASTLEKSNSFQATFNRRSVVEMNGQEAIAPSFERTSHPPPPFEGQPPLTSNAGPVSPTPGFDILIRANQHSTHRWPQVTEF